MRRIIILALTAVVIGAGYRPCPGQRPDGGVAGRIDQVFAAWNRTGRPGGAVGVIRGGRLIHARGFGEANLEHHVPNTPKTVFRIGSTSKQFTAFSILLLEERRRLKLDDPLKKFFPEMKGPARTITVRHLLHHVSGIPDYLDLMASSVADEDATIAPARSIAQLCELGRVEFPAGTRFSYSNSNYLLLGEIVHRVSGMTLRRFAEKNIFKPLGMKSTHFHDDADEIVENRADGYRRNGRGWRKSMTRLEHVGDGGVFTTVEDLARWDANFYANRLGGGEALIRRMLTPYKLTGGRMITYACGIDVDSYRGLLRHAHGGAFVGYRAEMIRFPRQKTTIIVLANFASARPSRLAKRVADIVLEKELLPRAPR